MKGPSRSLELCLLLAVAVWLGRPCACDQPPLSAPPTFVIALDKPVDIRLNKLIEYFKPTFKADFEAKLAIAKKSVGRFGFWIARVILSFYMNIKGDPVMYEELSEIAEQTGVAFGDLVVFNYFYEIGCTTIIGYASDLQSVLFGSNLDYNYEQFLRDYSFEGRFTKNGQVTFIGDGIFGMVGVVRGQRVSNGAESFSIAINERDVQRGNAMVNLFFTEAVEVSLFIRNTLQLNSYDSALQAIETQALATAAYYTIAGTSETGGCVVERSGGSVHNKYCLNSQIGGRVWFLVQTNYDRDLPDPSDDYRRVPTEQRIANLTQQNFDADSLLAIMTSSPVHRDSTSDYRTITTVICQNTVNPRLLSTWQMYLWDDVK